MPKITKLKSGSWHAAAYDYTDQNGRRVMRSFTSPQKAQVEADLAAFLAEKKSPQIKRAAAGRHAKGPAQLDSGADYGRVHRKIGVFKSHHAGRL